MKTKLILVLVALLSFSDFAFSQQPSRLEMLKNAEKYNYDDTRFIPKFTYQSLNDSNLVRIRRDFKLDSIAGQGNEISQIINLMHWVHTVVRHDGSSDNPEPQKSERENKESGTRRIWYITNNPNFFWTKPE
ncbi:MAG: hypothetical protein LBN93_06660 [Candidatus Symbiothrix sp.]|nr:hypothetical protein [Candidatus Symbiothrix sp.]